MREHKNFWDRNAGRYDRFMRKRQGGIRKNVWTDPSGRERQTVLELAAGTGLID